LAGGPEKVLLGSGRVCDEGARGGTFVVAVTGFLTVTVLFLILSGLLGFRNMAGSSASAMSRCRVRVREGWVRCGPSVKECMGESRLVESVSERW
jgi:hypothetical protein